MTPDPHPSDIAERASRQRPHAVDHGSNGRIGWIVAGSLAAGLLAAGILVAAPLIPPTDADVTGAVLCGLALGWAMLAVLSVRLTHQPQSWATAPALFMGLSGLVVVAFGSGVDAALGWVWPPALLALVVWMFLRVRRQMGSPSGRRLLYAVFTVLALAAGGGGFEAVSAVVDTEAAMPGKLIDIGGHRLHLNCTGSGSPTVVIEPGAGGISSDLELITRAIAEETRVCVYDRAGRGWSEPAGTPQDGAQVATHLHTLLRRGDIAGPFVLAGHSFGGLYALTFAARYPGEVAGMVLVDSTAPASAVQPPTAPSDASFYDVVGRISALLSLSARVGMGRLVGVPASHLRSTIEEYLRGGSFRTEAASLRDFGERPLVVLTAGSGSSNGWLEDQQSLATLSANSVHRIIDGVDHPGMVSDEKGAAAGTRAILDVLSSLRAGRPLAD